MRKIYIWSGQSNACDRGVTAQLPVFENASRMFVYRRTLPWVADVRGVWQPAVDVIDESGATAGSCGAVALAFMNRMATLYPDDEIAVVPYGYPGSVITNWAKSNRNATVYGAMIQRALWADEFADSEIAGFCWWQGEAETTNLTLANGWCANFSNLVSNVRVDMANLNLPTAFVKLGNTGNTSAYWNTMRGYQAAMYMRNLAMVDIDGLPALADKTHYPTSSYLEIGIRMADAIYSVS
jgi:Carbohydrate esterase, sialic acid-specific acetylesterase